ncbi:MAG: hypothetical protein QXW41_07255 [Fervidicoccaceae archaeon]
MKTETASQGKRILENLDKVREELEKRVSRVRRALGEHEAVRTFMDKRLRGEKERTALGVDPADRYGDYRAVRRYLIPVHTVFLMEVGESVSEKRVFFDRFDEEAYWLPAHERVRRPRVLALVDASDSIEEVHYKLFLSCVASATQVFDIEYRLVVFSSGVQLDETFTPETADWILSRMPRGGGTVWDQSVAEAIRESALQGVRLIQVLSDFAVIVTPVASEAVKEYKRNGGLVACYSTTGSFLDFCDFKHELPELPTRSKRSRR